MPKPELFINSVEKNIIVEHLIRSQDNIVPEFFPGLSKTEITLADIGDKSVILNFD